MVAWVAGDFSTSNNHQNFRILFYSFLPIKLVLESARVVEMDCRPVFKGAPPFLHPLKGCADLRLFLAAFYKYGLTSLPLNHG